MSTSLSTQMLGLYDKYTARADLRFELFKLCGLPPDTNADTGLEKNVRGRYLQGVHNAFQETILTALTKECGTQQEVATALGLEDRSNISHMKKSGKLKGIHFSTALHRFPHLIQQLPSPELAASYGFALPTSYLKAVARKKPSIEGAMTHQDFYYLVGVLAEPGWEAAIHDRNQLPVRELATQIILDKTISDADLKARRKERAQHHVKMLQGLRNRWGYFTVLSLLIISDDIPDDLAHEGVTT